MSFTGVAKSWNQMMDRVFNKKSKDYKTYGGAGVMMCEFIAATPLNLKLLIGDRPDGHSIDRILGTNGYTCGKCRECLKRNWLFNVRWATPAVQRRNIKNNLNITFNGKTMCLEDWAKKSGVNPGTLHSRYWCGDRGENLFRSRYAKKI